MRFAKRVFTIAGIWGLLIVVPLFFLQDVVERQSPPAITHPEFYYGFVAVTTAWQIAFLIIGADPVRLRPLIPAAVLEKVGWVGTVTVLFALGRVPASSLIFGAIDGLLGVLFIAAMIKTAPPRL
jgi:hypothetical protein